MNHPSNSGGNHGPGALDGTLLHQRHEIRQMASGFRQAQILLTCIHLGVFEALADRRATSAEIATAVGADPRGVDLLLNAAAALGLLEKREGRFANAALADACLTPGGPGTMVSSLHLYRAFYRRWGRLAEAVRTGERPGEDRRDEQADDWVRDFVYGLYDIARPVAPFVAQALALPGDRPLRVIDVGGCHGAYSLALARRHPLLTATVFELPAVVPFARQIIDQAGLSDRVTVQAGDFQQDRLGHGYDVALVFGVLNGEPPRGRPALIRKVYRCLHPGGRIVLRDFVLDPDRAGPPEAAIFALQMLLATEAGGLDTRDDWARWLPRAGFQQPHTLALPVPADTTLIVARKPAP